MESLEFEKLSSTDPKVKYGFAKELIEVGKGNPTLLYPYFDRLLPLITSKNNIIKWTAIDTMGYLSTVDTENKIGLFVPTLVKQLHDGHLITCNHAIFALGLIAKNKPKYRNKIISELLSITEDTFDTEECKNIAIGKTIETLTPVLAEVKDNTEVLDFVKKATANTRNATSKKAMKLLINMQKANAL